MQEPLEGISFNFALSVMPSDTERASVPASIAESFNEGDPVHATASRSSGSTLSNAETLELFSSFWTLSLTRSSLHSNVI